MSMLKQQVAEIDREADVLFRKCRADALIDWELSAEADCVVVKYPQRSWANENLVSARVFYRNVCFQEPI